MVSRDDKSGSTALRALRREKVTSSAQTKYLHLVQDVSHHTHVNLATAAAAAAVMPVHVCCQRLYVTS
eukprot:4542-Heterococcus_DN1.PRE.1